MSAAGAAALAAFASAAIAAAALLAAWRANDHAHTSAQAARDSAKEARRANELAEEANERAARPEQIALTPAHIDWTAEWLPDASVLSVENTGTDSAHDVVLAVDALDLDVPRRTDTRSLIGPTDRIGINQHSWEKEADLRFDEADGYLPNVGFAVADRVFTTRLLASATDDAKIDEAAFVLGTLLKLEPVHLRGLLLAVKMWVPRSDGGMDPTDDPRKATRFAQGVADRHTFETGLGVSRGVAEGVLQNLVGAGLLRVRDPQSVGVRSLTGVRLPTRPGRETWETTDYAHTALRSSTWRSPRTVSIACVEAWSAWSTRARARSTTASGDTVMPPPEGEGDSQPPPI
jgi:hypothetical protein